MKQQYLKNSAVVLALLSSVATLPAFAETVEVNVTGTVTPVACTPTLGSPAFANYGDIPRDTLSADEYTVLGIKETTISIGCDAQAKVAFSAKTLRPDTAAGSTDYIRGLGQSPVQLLGITDASVSGLGLSESDEKIGGFAMVLEAGSLTLDTSQGDYIVRNDNRAWAPDTVGELFSRTTDRHVSFSASGGNAPQSFEIMQGKLKLQAYINKASELTTATAIELNGAASIELVYL